MSLENLYWVLGANLLFSFALSLTVYLLSLKVYRPLIITGKDNKPIDLHKKYDPFHPHDKICFIYLWFGAFFCAFIKIIFSILFPLMLSLNMRILNKFYDCDTNPIHRKKMKKIVSCYTWLFLIMIGIIPKQKKLDYKNVYKKYLGDDYNFDDDKYSLIISNHIGYSDTFLCLFLFSCGFVARKDVENNFLLGPICKNLKSLFLDRNNAECRQKIFELLLDRQKSFYNGSILNPITIFPEGVNTCGRNIMKFKKGAFYSLLPIKPVMIIVNQKTNFHLSVGASNHNLHFAKNLCHFANILYYSHLPTIRPTEYMFEKYNNLGTKKFEIYANVVQKIYSEIGGLEESNMGFRDMKRYIKAMKTGIYDENDLYESQNENNNKKDEVLEFNSKKKKSLLDQDSTIYEIKNC